ncbi:MAG: hypothetical protein KAX93_03025 [Flavobacterium sp.]|nr:hypothetical protein [Flavobacterium sp.]MBP8157326.1 hypothetical protein [Flavobacterium sp.]
MKRILGLLTLLFLINACDDGDLTVDNIDFSEVSAQKCSSKDVIYKIKDSEMLVLAIPATTFINDETIADEPIEVSINATNQVIYRQYNGTVSSDNICPTIPSATPNLTEEWNATAGTIQITTTAVKTTDATTNATKITGYKHYIVFKNITFQKPSGTQVYETYVFGNYTTSVSPLAFGFDEEVDKSTCDNRIFNFSGGESLVLDLADYANLIQNSVTTSPRTALLNSGNKLTYKLFSNTVIDAYFCTTPTPTSPTLLQEWIAENGVADTSGIIEVSTTTLGAGFQHTIRLKKVTMKKGNSTFLLGDDYLYGTFVTNP